MWKIRDLKKKARGTFKRNYIGIVITCFIAAVVMGSFTNPLKEVRTIKDTYFDQLNGTVLLAVRKVKEHSIGQEVYCRCLRRIPRVQVTLFTVF